MEWVVYGAGIVTALVLAGVFAVQVLYTVAEYNERAEARRMDKGKVLTPEPCGFQYRNDELMGR